MITPMMPPKKNTLPSSPSNNEYARVALVAKKGKVVLTSDHSPPPKLKASVEGRRPHHKAKAEGSLHRAEGEVHTTSLEDSQDPLLKPKSLPYQAKLWPDMMRNLPPTPSGFDTAACHQLHPSRMPPEDIIDLQDNRDLNINIEEQLLLKKTSHAQFKPLKAKRCPCIQAIA